jgi:hypothetical protein
MKHPETKTLKTARDAKGRILKGHTGNSGGLTSEQRAARDALGKWLCEEPQVEAGKTAYLDQLRKGNTAILIDWMNRTAGKPKEHIELAGEGGGPVRVTTFDLRRLDPDDVEALQRVIAKSAGPGGE